MNLAELAIKKNVITWMFIIFIIFAGLFSYTQLSRLEDPEFTIKEAKVFTSYSGATPREVEEEVTERVERAIQQLSQLKRVTSISKPGVSEVTVVIKDQYDKASLPQVWDELRRKIHDMQSQLPPGAGPSVVYDDFGDVYGNYYALTGQGFSYRELENYADLIKKELLLVPGVAKVTISGIQQQTIFVDISRSKMSQLGLPLETVYDALRSQNIVVDSGNVRVGDEYIRIHPTGTFASVKEIGNLLVGNTKNKKLIHLDDIATITRSYKEVPDSIVRYNGQTALGIAVSYVKKVNVVDVGAAIKNQIATLKNVLPVGIVMNPIYLQPVVVQQSIDGFIDSLLQALAIVIVVLLLFMGLTSGILIATILLLTILATFIFMYFYNIELQRISLGALIIALGMLVDNAIVVNEGILVQIQRGIDGVKAAINIVKQTSWPLLGATIVGILAFAPISLSQDSTGEYTRSLFSVIGISLLLSWLLAVTVAPLLCVRFIKQKKQDETKDPYQGRIFQYYKHFLIFCLKRRYATLIIMLALLVTSIYGFAYVKQSFFPDSTTPLLLVDYWRAQGTDIRTTDHDMEIIQKYIRSIAGVSAVTNVVGEGAQRFMLVYSPENPNSSYGQFIVRVNDYRKIDEISDKISKYLSQKFPNSEPKIKKIRLGPGRDAKIEARFSGPNPEELRKLSDKAQAIMHKNPNAINIRDDWRQKVKVIQPQYSEQQGRLTGISRKDLSDALKYAYTGQTVGLYREKDKLLPIVSRPPDQERLDIATMNDLQIWSPILKKYVPISQVVNGYKTKWQDEKIARRNRIRTITAQADPDQGVASHLFNQLKPKLEAIPLPSGYRLEWGGEYEDSSDAQIALATKIPFGILAMFIVVVMLFNAIRQPLIIWLCVPLSFIGVTFGLLITNSEFGFMALLGFLSLSGMLIKNAIVLIDQIDLEIAEGNDPFEAIIHSAVSRFRPVVLAAITTVLGMIPLLFDAFFISMAVVIMFGLTFATILTLIIVPVLYAIFFRIPFRSGFERGEGVPVI